MRKGKLIVIDGSDGSGKSTQTKLLLDYLQKVNPHTKHLKFPQYEKFYGQIVAKFLRGEFGNIDSVSPYLASLAYANDRASAKTEMDEFLSQEGFLILDRYVPSNMGHQGAKFKTGKERAEYLEWDYQMEYEINQLPMEDVVIYLYVPYQTAIELRSKEGTKDYLQGRAKDIHEEDVNHLMAAEETYNYLADKYAHWVKIECVENGTLLTPEQIHEKVKNALRERNIIRSLSVKELTQLVMTQAKEKGFGTTSDEINVAEKIALIHSEISEAFEAYRHKNMTDRHGFEEELGDSIQRILHLCGAMGIDIEKTVLKKLELNTNRE